MILSIMLFSTPNREVDWFGEKLTIGSKGPVGVGTSKLKKEDHAAKVSSIATIVTQIANGKIKVKAAKLNSGIYGEVKYKDEDNTASFYYNNEDNSISWNGHINHLTGNLLPVLSYILASEDPIFLEFQEAYKALYARIKAGENISPNLAYLLCDSFYYSTKEKGLVNIEVNEKLLNENISQLIRANKNPLPIDMGVNAEKFVNANINFNNKKRKSKKSEKVFQPIQYDWNEKSRKSIPDKSVLDLFIPSPEYNLAMSYISGNLNKVVERLNNGLDGKEAIGNEFCNLIFTGKPGTGKTTVAEAIAAALGLPLYTVPTIKNGEEDEYQGKIKPDSESDGFKFCETPFLEAYKNGGVVVLEEFNIANPGLMMGVLGQALEKPFILMEDGYKPVHRHPLCVVIMTCNTMTQGAQEPNEALVSRAPVVLCLNDPKPEDFKSILKRQSNASEADINNVYAAFSGIINYLQNEDYIDIIPSVTLRHCLGALKLMSFGVDFYTAVKNTLCNVISIKDLDLAKEVYDAVIDPMAVDDYYV